MNRSEIKIVSGGRTGVEQGALEAAKKNGGFDRVGDLIFFTK